MNKCAIILSALILLCSCSSSQEEWNPGGGGGDVPPTPAKVNWAERAHDFHNTMLSLYGVKAGATAGLMNENYPKKGGDGAASFLWPFDGWVSGLACLNRLGYDVAYTDAVESFQRYWRNSGAVAVGGYGSSTNGTSGGGDRFYDDNSIVGLNLVEAYRQTSDKKYLDRCAQIVNFLKSGEDSVFGGGLWWNESVKNQSGRDDSNKPACANGYATWFLMSYYEVCPAAEQDEVLAFAKRLYTFLYNTLRDPEDNVYWNSKQADGSINRTKWTYNTGAMIAAGVRLYKATGDSSYLNAAKKSADGAYNYFVRPRNGINLCYPTNDPWFTIKLIRAYIELEPFYSTRCKQFINAFIAFTEHAYKNARTPMGLFMEDWSGVQARADRDCQLLMQDAALESMGALALYSEENAK